ncbi:MAG: hypothetical protein IPJ48_08500 [Propionivibrio sp.]|uniref:Uncharacterized protein n=1 Tax=Candidatus Propionivibrio dominans TaxID=2954373 RepID=A0A9D7FDM1_9RHOO|nr:hypothetical protein [Candidatus Propionivibrio dominans]
MAAHLLQVEQPVQSGDWPTAVERFKQVVCCRKTRLEFLFDHGSDGRVGCPVKCIGELRNGYWREFAWYG